MARERGRLAASSCRETPEPGWAGVEDAGVDDGAAGQELTENVGGIGVELGDLGAGETPQPLDVAHAVEEPQERTKPGLVVDDGAGRGAHLEVGRIAAQQRCAGSDDRSNCHRSSVARSRLADDPLVHTRRWDNP